MEVRWRIELLGGLRAVRGDQVITRFRTKKTALLLAYLAYHRHRSHQREEQMELLWPEGDPEAGRQSFRKALSALRQQFEPPGQPPGSVFVTDRTSVQLNPAAVTTDVEEFRGALRSAARAESGSEQTKWLAQAVEQYRGELLPGHYEDWILQERQWLAESYFQALSQLLAHLEQAGEYERALQYAQQGVSADPLREEAHRDLMRLYAAVGAPAAAQRQYRELERLLNEQLRAAPDAATCLLAHEIDRLALLRPSGAQALGRSSVQILAPTQSTTAPSLSEPERAAPATPTSGSRYPRALELPSWEGENRLVTVLLAEMSGSLEKTAMLPPEEAAAWINGLLTAMVDILLKYEARVDRFLGDGVLALFGTPRAHEDDAERAIRAAMEIGAAARRLGMEVSTGIHTGEVSIGGVPSGTREAGAGGPDSMKHPETIVVGPVVSLASRLQGQAAPGQILVSEGTYHQTRRAFEFSSRSLEIRDLAQPVTAYAVGRAMRRPEKTRGIEGLRAELIGRDEELAKLKAALAKVRRGQGQLVSLTGEAGLGKSRLVAELKAAVSGQWSVGSFDVVPCPRPAGLGPLLTLEGHCLELGMTAGYSLFVDLFRDYFAWRPEEDERARGERLAASLHAFRECGELTAERAEEMGPLLGRLLSAHFDTDWDERLQNAGPEQIRHQTFMAVRDFLVALAQRHPLLLVCEDLHWADSLSLDLLSLLMEALPLAPICLLCVYRPEREHKCRHLAPLAERKCPERLTEIRLRELTPEQSGELIGSLLPIQDLPDAVKALILERSRGNPFFLEEVVRSLLETRVIFRDGDAWKAREGITPLSVPESLQSMILSRVDRLRPDLKQVLQSASVIGRVFRRRLLEQTTGHAVELDRALGELEDQGLVYQERAVPEEEYSFKHVLVQETIYQNILRRHRAGHHQKVAEVMEALYQEGLPEYYEELAYHYERSADCEKAVEYLLKAGEKAKRAWANEAAIDYFQRALERLERETGGQGDGAKQHQLSSRAVSPSPPPTAERVPGPVAERSARRLEALRGLGQIHLGIGKAAEAEEQFRQAIAVGRAGTRAGGGGLAPRELARLYYWLCDALNWQGKRDQVLAMGQEGLALVRNDPESVEAALMNHVVGIGYLQTGEGVKGWELIRQSARFLEHLPYTEELRAVYFWIVQMYANEDGTVGEATRWLRIFERKAQQHHDLRAQGDALNLWGDRLGMGRGDLRGAIPLYVKALELYGKIGGVKHESACLAVLGRLCLSLGRLQEAEEYAQRGRLVEQALERGWMMAGFFTVMGTVSLCQGHWKLAEAAFQETAQRFRTGPIWWSSNTTSHALGRAYLAGGRRSDARQQFQGALALAETDNSRIAEVLSGLEETDGPPEEFRAFCHRLREEQPEARDSRFVQWYLEPAQPDCGLRRPEGTRDCGLPTDRHEIQNPKSEIDNGGWVWHDPLADSSLTVQDGLEIRVANGRDLRRLNGSAPRLLRQAGRGDFAVQVVCRAVSEAGEPGCPPKGGRIGGEAGRGPTSRTSGEVGTLGRALGPAIGGILLWGNNENYLRLERGTRGPHEISFQGRLADPASLLYPDDVIIGRGRLPAERLFLRLERLGPQVRALCSADGQNWFTVGHVEFPSEEPVEIGLHAIGNINRLIYPGAYPEGTAIRFESFELWN